MDPTPGLDSWKFLAASVDNAEKEVRIALVGKYTGLQDSYLSVLKALKHSAIACARRLVVDWVESEDLEGGEGDDAPSQCVTAVPLYAHAVSDRGHARASGMLESVSCVTRH